MSTLDFAMFEFELGLAELDLYQHTLVRTNVRWRGQEREGGPIYLEELDPQCWKTYFRYHTKDDIEKNMYIERC